MYLYQKGYMKYLSFNVSLLLLTVFFAMVGCSNGGGGNSTDGSVIEDEKHESAMTHFISPEALEKYLKEGVKNSTSSFDGKETVVSVLAPAGAVGVGMSQETLTASADSLGSDLLPFSTTNLQEVGVDEADTIKTNGKYLYIVSPPHEKFLPYPVLAEDVKIGLTQDDSGQETTEGNIRVMSLSEGPYRAKELAVITLGADRDIQISGLYLLTGRKGDNPDLLIALSRETMSYQKNWFSPFGWEGGITGINIININDPANPVLMKEIILDGHLISSRRIGEKLYLVTRYTPTIQRYVLSPSTEEEVVRNQSLLEKTTLSELLPDFTIDGKGAGDLISPEDCYLPPTSDEIVKQPNLITVTVVDLQQGKDQTLSSACIVGPSEAVYVSAEAIYLATTRYPYNIVSISLGAPSGTIAITNPVIYQPKVTTDIHKLALTPDGIEYRGSATVEGHLGWEQDKKSFRMGEYNGVLRVVTSIGENRGDTATTLLTLLREPEEADKKSILLEEVSRLPNNKRPERIGKPGELLYAARFVGERAYLVTYRVTDPLYIIDLSDPTDPYIAGALHIPGYSDYLHPVGDNMLLGIGKDAIPDITAQGDGRGAWYQGLKLALFDISNPKTPIELASHIIGMRGTGSDALYDHHAITYLPADPLLDRPARLAIPLQMHNTPPQNYDISQPWAYYNWTHTGLYLFDIHDGKEEPAGIRERGQLIVEDNKTTGDYYSIWSTFTDRSVLTGDGIHYIHKGMVWSATWGEVSDMYGPQ